MLIDDKLLDEVAAKAKASERLRMNYNLHETLDAKAQRFIGIRIRRRPTCCCGGASM